MNGLALDKNLIDEIDKLLVIKRSGMEMDKQKRINIINEFLEEQIAYYKGYVKNLNNKDNNDIEKLDELFRGTLKEVWKFSIYKLG